MMLASGYNLNGQLGVGRYSYQHVPIPINDLQNIKQIAAGSLHTLFLKNDGLVWVCGNHKEGQLGLGRNNNSQNVPIPINGLHDTTQIATGFHHSFFLKSNGLILGCGSNYHGQLGLGHNNNLFKPTAIAVLNQWDDVLKKLEDAGQKRARLKLPTYKSYIEIYSPM